jgi:hypothetical protein
MRKILVPNTSAYSAYSGRTIITRRTDFEHRKFSDISEQEVKDHFHNRKTEFGAKIKLQKGLCIEATPPVQF